MDAHRVLMQDCREQGIGFLSTPFDRHSVDLLVALGLRIWKIPSGEITNLLYLRKIGALNQAIILSTGMAEVAGALEVLRQAGTPWPMTGADRFWYGFSNSSGPQYCQFDVIKVKAEKSSETMLARANILPQVALHLLLFKPLIHTNLH